MNAELREADFLIADECHEQKVAMLLTLQLAEHFDAIIALPPPSLTTPMKVNSKRSSNTQLGVLPHESLLAFITSQSFGGF
jgi:hypothetical protein